MKIRQLLSPLLLLLFAGVAWAQPNVINPYSGCNLLGASSPYVFVYTNSVNCVIALEDSTFYYPATWTVTSGSLPAGLSYSTNANGQFVISGTASAVGVTSFSVMATSNPGYTPGSASVTLPIQIFGILSPTSDTLASGTVGSPYSQIFTAGGDNATPYTWSLYSAPSTLPPGLSLSAGGGLSGTPTMPGTYNFTLLVTDKNGGGIYCGPKTLVVNPAPLSVTTTSLPAGTINSAYNATLQATGGTGTYTSWAVASGTLPAGLSLNTSTGAITGSPSSTATNQTITVKVTDSYGTTATSSNVNLLINLLPLPGTLTEPAATIGSMASYGIVEQGGTGSYTWALVSGSPPAGLTLNTATGVISGTPTNAATTQVLTLKVTDSAGASVTSGNLTFPINVAIQTTSLPGGTIGTAYNTSLAAAGGSGSYTTWTLASGTLPAGLTLNPAGTITGTPGSTATTQTITVKVTDTLGNTATSANLTITINASLTVTISSLPSGTIGVAYNASLAASGGSGSYTSWTLASGTLPAGLTLNPAGTITGTPGSTATTQTITVKVTDSLGNTATSGSLTITINASLTVTTTSLPVGTIGAAYNAALAATGGSGSYTSWTLASGTLPAGLTLDPAGTITGTPGVTATTQTITVKVTDSLGNTATSGNLTITINASLTVTTSSLPSGTIGAAYNAALAATGGSGSYTSWALAGGTLPAGLTLNPAGTITGTPGSTAATQTITVKVTDSLGNTAISGSLTITINAALTVTTGSLPAGTIGAAYSASLTASGGSGSYTSWTLASGTLPAGLTLNPTGTITGTPGATATTQTITVKVTDSLGNTATSGSLTITINAALTVTTISLPSGTIGVAYNALLAASGGSGSYTSWTLASGALPAGLTLNPTGTITGTPGATATTQTITVKVTDSLGNTATSGSLTITINAALTVTTGSLPAGTIGAAYNASLTASGGSGSYTSWTLAGGALPAGLTLNPTGTITGTPGATATTQIITVKVTDSAGNTAISGALTTIVNLSITTTGLPAGTISTPYNAQVQGLGGTGSYTWSLASGTLPAGLTLSPAGTIAGTPSASAATQTITVKVTDSSAASLTSGNLTILINIGVTTSSLPPSTIGNAYSAQAQAVGGSGNYTWSLATGALPAGLSLNAATGFITGTPGATATTQVVTIKVTDSLGNTATSGNLSLPVGLSITTSSLGSGTIGTPYSAQVQAAGGSGSYTWTVASGTLPAGLTLNPATGAITGTPAGAATTQVITVKVTDSAGTTQTSGNLTILINLAITTTNLPVGATNTAYSTQLQAMGGAGGYTWSLASGTFPTGLSLSTAGAITGTPTVATTQAITVKVTDSAGGTQTSGPLSIAISSTCTITIATSLPAGAIGTVYDAPLSAPLCSGYTWAIASGTLPAGLALNTEGTITGTPSAGAATQVITVKVTDAGGSSQTSGSLTLAINLSITTTSLSTGTIGSGYSAQMQATGGTGSYTWSLASGTLPTGLTLNTATGLITGTPTAAATTEVVTVKVTDSAAVSSTSGNLTIPVKLSIATTNLAAGTIGTTYSAQLQAMGGTGNYTWSLASGTPPAGLTLNPATGFITGTPAATATTQAITVKVTDSAGTTQTSGNLTIVLNLSITTTSLPAGATNAMYNTQLQAVGGAGSYTWSLISGSFPTGLVMNAAGAITGTPAANATTQAITARVTDAAGTSQTSGPLTITISSTCTITITSGLPAATIGVAYNASLSASLCAGYTWSLAGGTLPAGLALDPSGTITGTPAANATTQIITVKVTDATGNAQTSGPLTLTVNTGTAPAITTTSLPAGTVGVPYNAPLQTTGGTGSLSWSLATGSLPVGLILDPMTGFITGTPAATATTQTITVKATDSLGNAGTSGPLTITINQAQQAPAVTVTVTGPGSSGPAVTSSPGQQLTVAANVSSAQATMLPIDGTLTLTFVSSSGINDNLTIDPRYAAQFIQSNPPNGSPNGTTQVAFTIPAGGTQATFPSGGTCVAPLAAGQCMTLTTGTLPGTVTLTATDSGGSVIYEKDIPLAPTAPVITNVTHTLANGTLTVTVTGFSPTREVTAMTFHFTPTAGTTFATSASGQVADVSVPVNAFASYYTGTISSSYGSAFTAIVPFTFSGTASAVASFTLDMTNSKGTSAPVSGPYFP